MRIADNNMILESVWAGPVSPYTGAPWGKLRSKVSAERRVSVRVFPQSGARALRWNP